MGEMTGVIVLLLTGAASFILSGSGLLAGPGGLSGSGVLRPDPARSDLTDGVKGAVLGRSGRRGSTGKWSGASARSLQYEAAAVDTAVMIDLLGAVLATGAPIEDALAVLADSCPASVANGLRSVRGALSLGADWETAWTAAISQTDLPAGRTLTELGDALRFAALTGASSAGMVYAYASQLRRRRNAGAERRAATLGVRLVVPLGICYLPAFICLGVLPVVVALVP